MSSITFFSPLKQFCILNFVLFLFRTILIREKNIYPCLHVLKLCVHADDWRWWRSDRIDHMDIGPRRGWKPGARVARNKTIKIIIKKVTYFLDRGFEVCRLSQQMRFYCAGI